MTYERTEKEEEEIAAFLSDYFPERYGEEVQTSSEQSIPNDGPELSAAEQEEVESMVDRVGEEFFGSKGTLGLAIDFLIVAESLSRVDDRFSGFR